MTYEDDHNRVRYQNSRNVLHLKITMIIDYQNYVTSTKCHNHVTHLNNHDHVTKLTGHYIKDLAKLNDLTNQINTAILYDMHLMEMYCFISIK